MAIDQGQSQEMLELESMTQKQKDLVDHLNGIGEKGYFKECIDPDTGMSLLDQLCYTQNEVLVSTMQKELSYFPSLVNHASTQNGGWTPLLWAAQRCNLEIA